MKWTAYPEPNGRPSRYAILSDCGRWTVAKIGAWPGERFEVWEQTGWRLDGGRTVAIWEHRGMHPSAESAKTAVMASNAV